MFRLAIMAAMVSGGLVACSPAQNAAVQTGDVPMGLGTDRTHGDRTSLRTETSGDLLRNQYNRSR